MKFKRQLFYHETATISINICVGFSRASLVMEGLDVGKTVERYRDDMDYEYSITVKDQELVKLYQLTGIEAGRKEQLVDAIAGKFNGNRCYSLFQAYLRENEVKFQVYSYI